jgi:hypothetical protein
MHCPGEPPHPCGAGSHGRKVLPQKRKPIPQSAGAACVLQRGFACSQREIAAARRCFELLQNRSAHLQNGFAGVRRFAALFRAPLRRHAALLQWRGIILHSCKPGFQSSYKPLQMRGMTFRGSKIPLHSPLAGNVLPVALETR